MCLSTFSSRHTTLSPYPSNRLRNGITYARRQICGTRWRSWLRHCATNRKVAGSIPDGVIDIILPALGLTQPLTGMSTTNISWG